MSTNLPEMPTDKDNLWYKNNTAHTIMREKKKKGSRFCMYCRSRGCTSGEMELPRGNKALKKCKFADVDTKLVKNSEINEHYINIKNGERSFNE